MLAFIAPRRGFSLGPLVDKVLKSHQSGFAPQFKKEGLHGLP